MLVTFFRSVFVTYLATLYLILSTHSLKGQDYAFGVSTGMFFYTGDLISYNEILKSTEGIAFGLNLKHHFSQQIDFNFNFSYGEIAASSRFANLESINNSNVIGFKSGIFESNIMVHYHPFKKTSLKFFDQNGQRLNLRKAQKAAYLFNGDGAEFYYKEGYFVTYTNGGYTLTYDLLGNYSIYDLQGNLINHRFQHFVSPFLKLGIGTCFADPIMINVDMNDYISKENNFSKVHLNILFGLGIEYGFAPFWTINLDFSFRKPTTDYLDGFSKTRNPNSGDWYYFTGIQLNYNFGNKRSLKVSELDRDKDGVTDEFDQCVDTPGPITLMGCPDQDGDGVKDSEDFCPDVKGKQELSGCPDKDGDRIRDDLDSCPYIPGEATYDGCPPPKRIKDALKNNISRVNVKLDDGSSETYQVNDLNQKKYGEYIRYAPSGKIIEKAYYQNDTLHGTRVLYHHDGKVQIVENYQSGAFDGPFLSYFPSGELNVLGHYRQDKMIGDWNYYFQNQQLKEIVRFKDNEENGPFVEYYKNGKVKVRGNYYKGDQRHGLIEFFDQEGKLTKVMNCLFGDCKTKEIK